MKKINISDPNAKCFKIRQLTNNTILQDDSCYIEQ